MPDGRCVALKGRRAGVSMTVATTKVGARMATAGGSARGEYQRRRAVSRAAGRSRLRFTIPIVAATPVVVYVACRVGGNVLDGWFRTAFSGNALHAGTGMSHNGAADPGGATGSGRSSP